MQLADPYLEQEFIKKKGKASCKKIINMNKRICIHFSLFAHEDEVYVD